MNTPNRVLITGSSGMLGKRLCAAIKEKYPKTEILVCKIDLTKSDEVERFLNSLPKIDSIFHLAALVPVEEVNQNPSKAFLVNVGGTLNLLSFLKNKKPKIIFASSSHVYGLKNGPLSECDPLDPISLYGRTKLIAENLVQSMSNALGLHFLIARIFSMHDENQTGSFLRPNLERRFKDAESKTSFTLEGGNSKRDFTSAKDVASLIIKLAWSDAQGLVNVASGTPQTVAEFAQSLTAKRLNVVPTGETNNLFADTTRLEELINAADSQH
jgi:nucleoside-diphosphate-sugar epimerase